MCTVVDCTLVRYSCTAVYILDYSFGSGHLASRKRIEAPEHCTINDIMMTTVFVYVHCSYIHLFITFILPVLIIRRVCVAHYLVYL